MISIKLKYIFGTTQSNVMLMAEERDVIIIGAGIAGLTASIFSARQGLDTLVIGRDLGGQLLMAHEIRNYPGLINVNGYELIRRVERQARESGVEIVFDEALGVSEEGGRFKVRTLRDEYVSRALILALGKAPRELGVPGESAFKGKGVSYCVTCDGPLYKGRVVALIGAGFQALEGAIVLSDIVKSGYWIVPGEKPAPDEEAVKRVMAKGVLNVLTKAKVIEIKGDKRVRSIVVKTAEGSLRELTVDGVFVEMGYVTKTDFLKGFVELNEKGEILIDELCRTSRRGVFAAGDVTTIPFKQAVISAAQGAIAALSAYAYITAEKSKVRRSPLKEGRGFQLRVK